MRNTFKLLICCFFFLGCSGLSAQYAQHEIVPTESKPQIARGIYDFERFDLEFQKNQKSLDQYNEGRRITKLSKYIAAGGVLFLVTGLVRRTNGLLFGSNSSNTGENFMKIGLIAEAAALCIYLVGSLQIYKAKKRINKENESNYGHRYSKPTIFIGSTPNGLGLFLRFG